jgi:4-amino-4-deoxy-L-arabinose transferase-like glycosyltransferase
VIGIVLVVLLGIAMRVWVLHSGAGLLDSDEGVPGLMARRFLDGHLSTFYWGQQYGGSIEVVLDAIAVFIGGSTRLALKSPPLLEAALLSLLVWRVGRRTVGEWPGVLAALMVWIWPANYVWYSTKERVFYLPIVLLGLALLLLALRLDEQPRRWSEWVVFGFLAGIGWWTGPQIVFTAVPALLWLAWRHRRRIWPGVAYAFGASVVGAAPWIRANVHSQLGSLDTAPLDDHLGYLKHLEVILRQGIPTSLGLRFSYTGFWLHPPVGQILYWIALAALVLAAFRLWRSSSLIVVAALMFPLLAALSPAGGFVGEGRYMIFVWPLLALLLAGLLASWSHRLIGAVGLLLLVGVISVVGLRRLPDTVSPYAPDVRVPADMTPLIHGLERLNVRHAFAQYWVAYRLDYESGEHVHATPLTSVRSADYLAEARRAKRPGYVFVAGSATEPLFRTGLGKLGIPFARHRFGDFVVVVPDRPTTPEAVSQAAGSATPIP